MEMAELEGVAEEILVRLDAEDVLRCKSVCKSWYSLISSPYFVKAHLQHNLDHRKSDCRITSESPMICEMIGSSNGLVCISTGVLKFVVTNPSTREVRELKHLPRKYSKISCWGFGYDSRTDDYKVVVGVDRGERHVRFIGLSLKSNIWRFIADVNYVSSGYLRGILDNGALHWFMENNMKKFILSLDLSVEEFKEIPPPDDKTFVYDNLYRLGVLEECLCVFPTYSTPSDTYLPTWVMKKDNSWQLLAHDDYERNRRVAATYAIKINCPVVFKGWQHINLPIFVKTLVFRTRPMPCDTYLPTWVMKKDNSWQLLASDDYERNKCVIATCAIKIKCHVPYHSWRLCDINGVMYPSRCWQDINLPIFVKSLVSLPKPHPNNTNRKRKNNKCR